MGKKVDRTAEIISFTDNEELKKELNGSGHRACAIVGGSCVELQLERILKEYLIDDRSVVNELIKGFNAPLGTFSAKIKVCYSLRLLSKDVYDDLMILKDIRNIFAHHITDCTFEEPHIKNLISKLKYNKTHIIYFDEEGHQAFIILIMILDKLLLWILYQIKSGKQSTADLNYVVALPELFKNIIK